MFIAKSVKRLQSALTGVEVSLTSHPWAVEILERIEKLKTRKPGDPEPLRSSGENSKRFCRNASKTRKRDSHKPGRQPGPGKRRALISPSGVFSDLPGSFGNLTLSAPRELPADRPFGLPLIRKRLVRKSRWVGFTLFGNFTFPKVPRPDRCHPRRREIAHGVSIDIRLSRSSRELVFDRHSHEILPGAIVVASKRGSQSFGVKCRAFNGKFFSGAVTHPRPPLTSAKTPY